MVVISPLVSLVPTLATASPGEERLAALSRLEECLLISIVGPLALHFNIIINLHGQTIQTQEATLSLLQQVCHPNAAGIDIAADEIVVAIPEGSDTQAVRSFPTFNEDLRNA